MFVGQSENEGIQNYYMTVRYKMSKANEYICI